MGAISRNRWKRLFIGATVERTLEHLPCDLLIVKPDWFRMPSEISEDRAASKRKNNAKNLEDIVCH